MRAAASLLDGDPMAALAFNPLAVMAVVALAAMFVLWARRSWFGLPKLTITRPWVTTAFAIVVVAFWVARNIPGWTFLSPQ